jgi:DNA invertase Pin-like site-specific DNA recombinase
MKAIGYIRVSTEEQAREGVSLDMQREKIAAWVNLHDAELIETCADEGVSGTKSDRDGLRQAIDTAKSNKAVLVTYSISRLSRSTLHTLSIAEELDKAGCELVSIQENIDTTTPAGRVVFRVLAALAEFERDQLAERTRHGMAQKRAQGFRIGSVPHGFEADNDGRLVPVKAEQKIIALVNKLRQQGLSLRHISAELEKRGSFNRQGKPFNPKSVAAMLKAA